MSVYVDSPTTYPTTIRHKTFSHMWADSEDELHEMAQFLGLKRAWHQPNPPHSISHYDITPPKRTLAIRAGAVARELERNDFPRLRAKMPAGAAGGEA